MWQTSNIVERQQETKTAVTKNEEHNLILQDKTDGA
jgi:hypothetical protein